MKNRLTIFAVLGILMLVNPKLNAQDAPVVSTKYTVEQIDEMYRNHKMSRPGNVLPSQELTTQLKKDFPSARDIEWEKSEFLYEVEFEIGRVFSDDYEAFYDMGHNLIMYKAEISVKDLPAVVKNAALTKYPNFKFEDVDKIVKGKETFYKIELEKGDWDVTITLKSDGTIVSEKAD